MDQVFAEAQLLYERRTMSNHRNQWAGITEVVSVQGGSEDLSGATGQPEQCRGQSQEGGFPRAIGAGNTDDLSTLQRQVDIAQHRFASQCDTRTPQLDKWSHALSFILVPHTLNSIDLCPRDEDPAKSAEARPELQLCTTRSALR
jgi:hypothetical protein